MSSSVDSKSYSKLSAGLLSRGSSVHKVLVTDADCKHSIALARYIKRDLQNVYLIGHALRSIRFAKYYRCFDDFVTHEPLETTLLTRQFDQVIPVGGLSTLTVSRVLPGAAVLSNVDQLNLCYDKRLTIELADRLSVPVPVTFSISDPRQLSLEKIPFPCIVKPDLEAVSAKSVRYCSDPRQLKKLVALTLQELKNDRAGVLVQEVIKGPGHGFFALMDHGKPLRVFMHKRVREYPPSGGPSTAAAAYYSPRLEELGTRLLSHIGWNGVAMVEFKFDELRQDFVLLEINGKFWGSLELALYAGVNFGADLIRHFRNEQLQHQSEYRRSAEFYWPLDNDLRTLWRTNNVLRGVGDYFRPGSATNCGQSKLADLLKTAKLIKDVVLHRDA